MKIIRTIIILAVLVLGFGVAPQASAAMFSYTSGILVYNLSSTGTTVNVIFYEPNGDIDTTANVAVDGNDYVNLFPLSASSGFNGSVIISSATEIAATSNMLGYTGGTNVSAGSYTASSSGSGTVYLPTLMKSHYGYTTWYNVQNAGDGTATISVNYTDGTSASGTIAVGAAKTFEQATETHSASLFSAKITSNENIVVTVVEESTYITFAWNGFGTTAGSQNPVIPLINQNNYGWITGTLIQNIGTASTNVTVSYTPSVDGTACTETRTIAAGAGVNFTNPAFNGNLGDPPGPGSTCLRGDRFVGSAKVTGNTGGQPLVAVVNQLLSKPGLYKGGAYDAFNPAAASSKVIFPLIMDRNYGYYTGINVQNVGTSTTTVNCTFTGTSYTENQTLDPGENMSETQLNQIANLYKGSGTCVATGGDQKIIGSVNQLRSTGATDFFLVYEGVNVTP